jgi:tetratricopeptide (TPR) repeat protein
MRVLLLAGAITTAPLAAQNGSSAHHPLTAADSAAARRGYQDALSRNPDDSRSIYRLARLTPDRDSALALYRRYTELEPDDPWGWMALGDMLLAVGHAAAADQAWEEAFRLAPTEPEVVEGRAGFSTRLGRHWLQAGRPRRAAAAFERSLEGSLDSVGAGRVRQARALAGPGFEPGGGYQRDSEGNEVSRIRLRADLAPADGSRLGLHLGLTSTRNDLYQ